MPTSSQIDGWWRNAFERGIYPLPHLLHSREWTRKTRREVAFVRRVLALPRGAEVLDVGCGVGRHAVPLARSGYRVTGVDISRVYLRRARTEAARGRAPAVFLRKDMRDLDYRSEFDAAISLFTSFGYFADPRADLEVLKNIARALKPGGALLLDTINGTRIRHIRALSLANSLPAKHWSRLEDGTYVLEEPVLLRQQGGVWTRWTFLKGASRREMVSFVRMYSRESLTRLFRRAGFFVERVYGDMNGRRYDALRSLRLVILGKRPRRTA